MGLVASRASLASYTAGDVCADDEAIVASTSMGTGVHGVAAQLAANDVYVTTSAGVFRRDSASLADVEFLSMTATGAPIAVSFSDGDLGVAVSQDSGRISRYDPVSDVETWYRTLQKSSSSDSLDARPVVQLLSLSSPAFQSDYQDDLVVVGSRHDSDSTGNRIYGLNALTGATEWTFNQAATVDMDIVYGMALDPPSDTVYVTTDRTSASQDSVWAVDVRTGSLVWSANHGSFRTRPVLDGTRVYAVGTYGTLHALDAADGSELWSRSLGAPVTADPVGVELPGGFHVLVVDVLGNVFLIRDDGGSSSEVWSTPVIASPPPAVPFPLAASAELGRAYTADDAGNLVYLDLATGAIEATVPIDTSQVTEIELMTETDGQTTLVVATADGDLAKLCTLAAATAPVPALGPWGLLALGLALLEAGRRARAAAVAQGNAPRTRCGAALRGMRAPG